MENAKEPEHPFPAQEVSPNSNHLDDVENNVGKFLGDKDVTIGLSEELRDAMYGDRRVSACSTGYVKLYLCCAVLYLLSFMNGFDSSLMSSINAMQTYQDYFGLKSAGPGTGLVFVIKDIANLCSILFIWIVDYIGRKKTIMIGAGGTLIGVAVVSTAKTALIFIWGRFILFFFSAIGYVAVPVYLVEDSPPQYRGTLSGLFNTFYYCGSTIATLAAYGCQRNYPGTDLTFKIPLWLQMNMSRIGAMWSDVLS